LKKFLEVVFVVKVVRLEECNIVRLNRRVFAVGTSNVTPSFTIPVDEENHSHNLGDYPTFSPVDIERLYNVMVDGFMKNPATFTDGLVTAIGTFYLIKIF
jgi:hypothetical protein